MLDTACVANCLWDEVIAPAIRRNIASSLGLSEDEAKALIIFSAGIHDIGKATPFFIEMIKDSPNHKYLVRLAKDAGFDMTVRTSSRGEKAKIYHSVASGIIVESHLQSIGLPKVLAHALASIADAHHGQPSEPTERKQARLAIRRLAPLWGQTHDALFEGMIKLAGAEGALQALQTRKGIIPAPVIQIITGIVVMADWIASNADAFPYEGILPQSERTALGLDSVGLTNTWAPTQLPDNALAAYKQSFHWPDNVHLRPTQARAFSLAQAQHAPCLIIIEAPTGEGKTEAALMVAHLLGLQSGAQGVFFAAPTMTTANGLFTRMVAWANNATEQGEVSSLFLAHSKNQLSKEYGALKFQGVGNDLPDTGTVVATQWLSGPKKGILSNFVVGTVDQVLMLALQMRHSMLRHVGLAGKTIIIDEAHAYDVYMNEYLHTAIAWLARYGANVIVLSATLPPTQRKALLKAYGSQCGVIPEAIESDPLVNTEHYPLISLINNEGVQTVDVEKRTSDATFEIIHIQDEAVGSTLQAELADGGIALVVCNTIKRAQETFAELHTQFPEEVVLHHSAFVASERANKEAALLRLLGPTAHRGEGRPHRLIVVATQVVEQSLDIDADLLISDIAPMDLLIQRNGRIHRHDRPDTDRPKQLAKPKTYLRGFTLTEHAPTIDPGSIAVYGEKMLLATIANLPKTFTRPDDIPSLVHRVYNPSIEVPKSWTCNWEHAVEEERVQADQAKLRASAFRIPEPMFADTLDRLFTRKHSEAGIDAGHAQVRDTEPTIEVIAIQQSADAYGYVPLGVTDRIPIHDVADISTEDAIILASNSLRLPARMTRSPKDFEEIIEQLERQTPNGWHKHFLLRGEVALWFDQENTAEIGRFKLHYDTELGLEVIPK